jgi:hypothetical protein
VEDQRVELAGLRGELQALYAQFTHVTAEYDAGRLTLNEEAALLNSIIHATVAVMDRVTTLMLK